MNNIKNKQLIQTRFDKNRLSYTRINALYNNKCNKLTKIVSGQKYLRKVSFIETFV